MPGTGYEVQPCPERLPNDVEVGDTVAKWYGPPDNKWWVGKVWAVNKRLKKKENISVNFDAGGEYGATSDNILADAESYGSDKIGGWVLLKPIPIDLDKDEAVEEDEVDEVEEVEADDDAGVAAKGGAASSSGAASSKTTPATGATGGKKKAKRQRPKGDLSPPAAAPAAAESEEEPEKKAKKNKKGKAKAA